MTHIDLFSGIGGFALAAQWAGFKTVAFVEIEPYAQEIIKQNFGAVMAQPDSARSGSSNRNAFHEGWATSTVRGTSLQKNSVGKNDSTISDDWATSTLFGDIRTFDGKKFRGATLLTGGFPCQPFSQAGKRRGKEDDRYLWPEMLRVIHEARPAWVLGENVAGIVTMELDRVLSDLEGEGYAVEALVIPACAVDAKHRRDRVWIVGHAERAERRPHHETGRRVEERIDRQRQAPSGIAESGEDVADDDSSKRQRQGRIAEQSGPQGEPTNGSVVHDSGLLGGEGTRDEIGGGEQPSRWLPEPDVGRVAHGIPARVDRLKGLGNAIVPQVAFEIIKAIAELEQRGVGIS